MNDADSKVRQLLNQSIDDDLGPQRPAPAFNPSARSIPEVRLRRWAVPLLAAAIVAVVVGVTALASGHIFEGSPLQPAVSVSAPATSTTPTSAPSLAQLPPPASGPKPAESPSASSASTPTSPTTSAAQPTPGRASNVLDFNGYGAVGLGLTAGQVATLEPKLTRHEFGTACVQFYDKAPTQVGGPMLNILLTPPANRVIGISVPAAAVTDTGIRVGSTRSQITAAYRGKATEATSSQGGTVILVQGPRSWMGFLLDQSGTVKSMSVGSMAFAAQQELCVG